MTIGTDFFRQRLPFGLTFGQPIIVKAPLIALHPTRLNLRFQPLGCRCRQFIEREHPAYAQHATGQTDQWREYQQGLREQVDRSKRRW